MLDYTEYDTRLAAYAVVVERREGRDHVLLALWNERVPPLWTLPGGGVELGETVEDGVRREVREESGYDVALTGLLGVDTQVVPPERRLSATDRVLRTVRVVFAAEVVGGTLTAEVAGTTDEARWIPLDEVPELPRVGLVDIALAMRP